MKKPFLYGYAGNILRINLTTGKSSVQSTDVKFAKSYIGGRGFGAKILWAEVKNVDPLSEKNKLIICAGPLTGLFLPGAGKTHITAKSPLTYGYGGSNVGGFFGAELKYAGYDAIIIEGTSKKPVYIVIENAAVQIRFAEELWGKGSLTTEAILKRELGSEFQTLTIGPGSEKLVKYGCITSDFGRQAGRSGLGTVMGSKKLKAIAVRGDLDLKVADSVKFMKIATNCYKDCMKHPNLLEWQKYGTSQVVKWANEIYALPTKNFEYGRFEHADAIDGRVMRNFVVLDKGCFGCPMVCGKLTYSKKHNIYVEGAEYETLAMLGSNCCIQDAEDVLMANYLCDEYGIDTISTGNAIAFAMECSEKGIIREKINFGNTEDYFDLIRKIAFREGIGDVLAEGVKYAAKKWRCPQLAVQVKGMEQSGYMSNAAPANALGYMTADLGAHHNTGWAITYDLQVGRETIQGKAAHVIKLQHIRPLFDLLGVCRLQWVELGIKLEYYSELYSAATGWDYELVDLLKISEKVYNLTRAYWFREVKKFGREYDLPPSKYEKPLTINGKEYKIDKKIASSLLDEYYSLRGWNKNGKPTKQKLRELGLKDVINAIYR